MRIIYIAEECVPSHTQLFVNPWTAAHQAPLSTEFSRQEYCSGLPPPPPGDLPDPGIDPASLAAPALADGFFFFLTTKSHEYLKIITHMSKSRH